jgi:hypothetical protein
VNFKTASEMQPRNLIFAIKVNLQIPPNFVVGNREKLYKRKNFEQALAAQDREIILTRLQEDARDRVSDSPATSTSRQLQHASSVQSREARPRETEPERTERGY